MAKVVLRQEAIADLNNIWFYTFETWSETQADKYYATIKMVCNGIADNPNIGKEYDGINRNLLGIKSGKHIIFYQIINPERIEIIRILHERMDLKNRIAE
ncbi:type II toxin-antitoxin system RelE/ParE family toxin [Cyclobacterium qasimii]|uniref:Toxin n=2 Tax=Cyclobacterium qasimii TaxID=1350429 RepID=S7X4M9_9BACT|nr:type II toxin-antitoxin system RelE/ParE family toxin [Cyclobacterium qasimii]EPR71048.1 ParE toxin protein [Cyclobacterium qasimii M12-11B]GEO24028.1 plasmid stabilization protein ParE [Cyclobacterium qasimii]